jgi:hypothetical protein
MFQALVGLASGTLSAGLGLFWGFPFVSRWIL